MSQWSLDVFGRFSIRVFANLDSFQVFSDHRISKNYYLIFSAAPVVRLAASVNNSWSELVPKKSFSSLIHRKHGYLYLWQIDGLLFRAYLVQ